MDISRLEMILKLMRKMDVAEIKFDDVHIKLFESIAEPELPPEAKEMLDKLENDKTSDDDILMNPYAGLET